MEIPYTFAGLPPLPLEKARVAILPVAYDSTTSYHPGTRFGPQEIILASRFLELYDETLGFEPSDLGIATLPELWPDLSSPQAALEEVESYVSRILKKGVFPVILGGEHSVTFGAIKACHRKYPGLSVLVLDAHADLRESYQGTQYNHACVSRRILELGLPVSIIGVRSLPSEDLPFILPPVTTRQSQTVGVGFIRPAAGLIPLRQGFGGQVNQAPTVKKGVKNLKVIFADQLKKEKDWLSLVAEGLTEKVYLSIDLDFFDPAFVPAVGTPEPGGFGWDETNRFFRQLTKKHQIIGFDVVELNGSLHHTPSAYFASRLVYRLLGLFLL